MKRGLFITVVATFGLMLCGAIRNPPAQPKAPAKPQAAPVQVVVKYGGTTSKANTPTGPHMVFQAQVLPDGSVLSFLVANANEQKKVYSPQPTVADQLAQSKAGDLVEVVCIPPQNANDFIKIQSVKPYKAKPGEDQPNGYVFVESFDHKSGERTQSFITISKYLRKTTLKIPAHLDSNGDAVTDDVITGIASKIKAGQPVYVISTGFGNDATIALLAPWANHFTGKFVKLEPSATVDSNGDTGPAVELTDAKGKTVTALISGAVVGKKWIPNPTVLNEAHPLKPDADVDYITAASGDKRIWLVSIKPAKTTAKPQMSQNTP